MKFHVSTAAGPPEADLIEKETFGLVPIGVGVGIGIGIGNKLVKLDTDSDSDSDPEIF